MTSLFPYKNSKVVMSYCQDVFKDIRYIIGYNSSRMKRLNGKKCHKEDNIPVYDNDDPTAISFSVDNYYT